MPDCPVSVVVTTFNHARYIAAALESVLAQTHQASEVIVVDDGSTDATAAEAARFGNRIRLVTQSNQGVAGARNAGVQRASGALIALMDGDDLWHPHKLAAQVEAWRRHPEAGLISVQSAIVTDPVVRADEADDAEVTVDCRDRLADLVVSNFLSTTSQVAIPADVLARVGPSSSQYRTCSDFDLYLRIARHWPIAVVERTLCYWRYLPSSASGPIDSRGVVWWPELASILRQHAPHFLPPLRAVAEQRASKYVRDTAAVAFYQSGRAGRRSALAPVGRLIADQPLNLKGWLFLAGLAAPASVRDRLRPSSALTWAGAPRQTR